MCFSLYVGKMAQKAKMKKKEAQNAFYKFVMLILHYYFQYTDWLKCTRCVIRLTIRSHYQSPEMDININCDFLLFIIRFVLIHILINYSFECQSNRKVRVMFHMIYENVTRWWYFYSAILYCAIEVYILGIFLS